MLTLVTPGGIEQMFIDLGEPAQTRTLPPEPREPDAERVATWGLRRCFPAGVLPGLPRRVVVVGIVRCPRPPRAARDDPRRVACVGE